jgi:hypothetical protein
MTVKVTYELDESAIALVLRGLAKLPYEEVEGVISAIRAPYLAARMPPQPKRRQPAKRPKDPA